MREPGPHQGVIPFPGIDRWLLRAPAQRLQPSGQVVCMVAHPERDQNHRPDTLERPPIGVKASLEGPLFEDCQYALPLLKPQAGRATRNRACLQAGHITLVSAELSSPLTDGHATDAELAGDVGVGQVTSLEQPSSFQAAFFTLCAGEVIRTPDHGCLL
jgi:hypothetical protein